MQNLAERIERVRNDREHGSRWLVREAVLLVRDLAQEQTNDSAEQLRVLYRTGRELAQARPAMAALGSAVACVLSVQGGLTEIARVATHLLDEYDSAPQRIAEQARPYLRGSVMTCSSSGTVLAVLLAARQAIEQVIVLEGRPRYEGRDTARALSQQGIAVTLITDAQADIFLPRCQGIVVGADSILADGDVLNKAGTALLAWAGQGSHVPLYVLAESLKIAPYGWTDERLLEEKEPEEVLSPALPGVTVRNFYFDRTPYTLVNKIISEQGVLRQDAIQQIAREVRENERILAERSP